MNDRLATTCCYLSVLESSVCLEEILQRLVAIEATLSDFCLILLCRNTESCLYCTRVARE